MTIPCLISVILPIFNGSAHLERALESLVPALCDGVEVIAVDDGSTDDTYRILESFRLKYASLSFRAIALATNQGLHSARLTGLKYATGQWIGFLDADDVCAPRQYQRMADQGEKHQADLVICGSDRVAANLSFIEHKVRFSRTELICADIFRSFCEWRFGTGAMWNKLYRADLIRTAFSRPLLWRPEGAEDTLINIGAFLAATRVLLLSETLHYYVAHDASITQAADSATSFVRIFRAYAMALQAYRAEGPHVWRRITELYRRQLCFPCYAIAPGHELATYHPLLEEAVAVINRIYPVGLALLAACPPSPPSPVSMHRRAFASIKKAIRILSNRV